MKLPNSNQTLELTGDIAESEFSIGDPWLILEYLTKSIYIDIPRIIVQEIASNARDAHREIGTPNRPINIKLPNRFDTTLQIRDFGPGINPDRMHTIFKKYGNSTKRGDNSQTGGFGLGSKSPWAYCDSYNIRTTTLENNQLWCREYSAVKGVDRTLKLLEFGSPTLIDPLDPTIKDDDKHTGTTIIVEIQQKDFHLFNEWAVAITEYWEVRPIITGIDPLPTYKNHKVVYEEPGSWKYLDINRWDHPKPIILVDGIPYPLDTSSFAIGQHRLIDCPLVLIFPVGELTPALNRQSLQYDDMTKQKITERFKHINEWMNKHIEEQIANCLTLREAMILVEELSNKLVLSNFDVKPKWKGIDASRSNISKTSSIKMRLYSEDENKLSSVDASSFGVRPNVLIAFNDTDDHTPVLRVWSLFNNDKITCNSIVVISRIKLEKPDDKQQKALDDDFEKWKKDIGYDYLEIIPLSTIEKFKRTRKTINQGIVKAFTYDGTSYNRHLRNWIEQDHDIVNGTGIYVMIANGRPNFSVGNHLEISGFQRVWKEFGSPIVVGIPNRFEKKIGSGWKSFKTFVEEKLKETEDKIDVAKVVEKERHLTDRLTTNNFLNRLIRKLVETVEDKTSPIVRWIQEINQSTDIIKKEYPEYNKSCHLRKLLGMELFKLPTFTCPLTEYKEQCEKLYPLLFKLPDYGYQKGPEDLAEELAFYVNAKNKLNAPATVV